MISNTTSNNQNLREVCSNTWAFANDSRLVLIVEDQEGLVVHWEIVVIADTPWEFKRHLRFMQARCQKGENK